VIDKVTTYQWLYNSARNQLTSR